MVSALVRVGLATLVLGGLAASASGCASAHDTIQREFTPGQLQQGSNVHAFQAATWPEAMLRPLFCRYSAGMKYGDHVDGAIMGDPGSQVRSDIAMTVCLSDPADYDGGELIIDAAGVPAAWRGNAGDVIVYPADTLHRVTEVTRGTRDVAISWIQSMVREGARRRILFDLKTTLEAFDALPVPPVETEAIRRSYLNLIRMWA